MGPVPVGGGSGISDPKIEFQVTDPNTFFIADIASKQAEDKVNDLERIPTNHQWMEDQNVEEERELLASSLRVEGSQDWESVPHQGPGVEGGSHPAGHPARGLEDEGFESCADCQVKRVHKCREDMSHLPALGILRKVSQP